MQNDELARFGVSIPNHLLVQFDHMIQSQGYDNRSEAIRDLIRKSLLQPPQFSDSQLVAGTIVLVYDHHASDLTELQHEYRHDIISTMHIHLNDHQCLEIIVVRGEMRRLRELGDRIRVLRGVLYADLSVTHIDSASQHYHQHHSDNQLP